VIEWIVLGGTAWILSEVIKARQPPSARDGRVAAARPQPGPPARLVALVGRANSGKSSTGNALLRRNEFRVGPVHGTTQHTQIAPFKRGYQLLDTPGLFDSGLPMAAPFDLRRAEIVVFVCTGQLLRPEVDEVQRLVAMQHRCNQFSNGRRRRLLIYANQQDVVVFASTPGDLAAQEAALRGQVERVAPSSAVVFGTAGSRAHGIEPNVASVASILDDWMDLD
jgi:hypothetical protein